MASIGGNLCNGIPSADMPPPLIALDATVKLTGPQRSRSIPLQDLYRHVRRLTLRKGELLTEIVIPKQPPRTAGAYIRLTRAQVDIALVSAAVKITLDKEETISDCRIVLGAVAPTPLRAHKAETFLRKKPLRESIIERTGQIAAEECQPITDLRATADYRRAMAATLVDRAAKTAISRIGEGLN
jgi:carbon-monoxide dehydrogenase medium subunit